MTRSKTLIFAAALAAVPSVSKAGGFDVTGQPIDIIFEKGSYIEGRVGIVAPDVEGTNPLLGGFGNTGNDTPFFTLGAKMDFTDRISGAIIFDTPYLRDTTYNAGIFAGTDARVEAQTITAIARFKASENFSVYGGPRFQASAVDLQGPFVRTHVGAQTTTPVYDIDDEDHALGLEFGAAAEIPKYKIRAAVTYNSEIEHDFDSVETFSQYVPAFGAVFGQQIPGSFEIHTPQSVNIDLQAPVTTSTLVKANIRWVDWGGVDFTPPGFLALQGRPVVEYTEDTITYRLTVAQRLNDNFAVFVTGSYEENGGEEISLFKTVDGGYSLGGGVVFENGDGLTLTVAGEYRWLNGITGPQVPTVTLPGFGVVDTPDSNFDDPTAFGLSMKIGYNF